MAWSHQQVDVVGHEYIGMQIGGIAAHGVHQAISVA